MATPGTSVPPGGRLTRSSECTVVLRTREDESWQELKKAFESIKTNMSKIRSEPMKEAVEKTTALLSSHGRIRDTLHAEWRVKVKTAGQAVTES